jgi:hypothetical protein
MAHVSKAGAEIFQADRRTKMSNVVAFPAKPDGKEPEDDWEICKIVITGKGDGSLWIHNYIETVEQYNWLIAKITAVAASVIEEKNDVIDSTGK